MQIRPPDLLNETPCRRQRILSKAARRVRPARARGRARFCWAYLPVARLTKGAGPAPKRFHYVVFGIIGVRLALILARALARPIKPRLPTRFVELVRCIDCSSCASTFGLD